MRHLSVVVFCIAVLGVTHYCAEIKFRAEAEVIKRQVVVENSLSIFELFHLLFLLFAPMGKKRMRLACANVVVDGEATFVIIGVDIPLILEFLGVPTL